MLLWKFMETLNYWTILLLKTLTNWFGEKTDFMTLLSSVCSLFELWKCPRKLKISPLWFTEKRNEVRGKRVPCPWMIPLKIFLTLPSLFTSLFLYHCPSTAPPISHPSLSLLKVVYDEVMWMNECGMLWNNPSDKPSERAFLSSLSSSWSSLQLHCCSLLLDWLKHSV